MRLRKLLFALVVLLCAVSCDRGRYVSFSGYAQGGIYNVKYNARGVHTPFRVVRDSVEAILRGIDNSVSGYNKSSLLSRYNSGEVSVGKDRYFRELDSLSEHYRVLSEGAFNAAAGPLFDIWGFGFTADSLPQPEEVAAALELCSQRKKLNFNAIAQGYSCDVIASYLESLGVSDMLVDIGEIFCRGVNPSGQGWSIGIDDPYDGNDTPGASLKGIWVSDGEPHGVVTSGNYRKFYIRDGRKYAHTIDPRTGYPVTHDLLSATIIAPTGAMADALATWCMVVGPEEAQALILSCDEVEGCLITSEETWYSPGFLAE